MLTLPGMRDRCVRIGSAGKTFSATGWKVGWVTGAAPLIQAVARAHQFVTFTTPPNLQRAVAFGLGQDDGYFRGLGPRSRGSATGSRRGFAPPAFGCCPAPAPIFSSPTTGRSASTGRRSVLPQAVEEAGVAAIPLSAFYRGRSPPASSASASASATRCWTRLSTPIEFSRELPDEKSLVGRVSTGCSAISTTPSGRSSVSRRSSMSIPRSSRSTVGRRAPWSATIRTSRAGRRTLTTPMRWPSCG